MKPPKLDSTHPLSLFGEASLNTTLGNGLSPNSCGVYNTISSGDGRLGMVHPAGGKNTTVLDVQMPPGMETNPL